MKENVFTVDLGDLQLTDAQRQEINGAIQSAVAGTLAKNKLGARTVLFPIHKWPKGPIIWGIIARPWDRFKINQAQILETL